LSQQLADQIAQDFIDFLDEFHTYPQPYDDAMDAEFYEQYARVLREQSKWGYFNWKTAPDGTPRPLFSPSSAGKDERQLYEKARKSQADKREPNRNQRDWTGLGSQVGGYIQREVMLAERHFEKLTGKAPRFKFERTERNEPAFEHFKKVIHEAEYAGEKFGLNGLPDGIMEYVTDDGEILRVGLEVKSVQKSYTDFTKISQPKADHVGQTNVYSEMYGLDYYIVLYHLTYGADWNRDFSRNKAFGRFITQDDRNETLNKFARVTQAWRTGIAPAIDLDGWKFNDYKTAIAKGITDEEFQTLKAQVKRAQRSGLPQYKKDQFYEAYEFIRDVREGEAK
jgi:DNA-binding protein H-NS